MWGTGIASRIVHAAAGAILVLGLTAACGTFPPGPGSSPTEPSAAPAAGVEQVDGAGAIDGNWLENWPGIDYQDVYQVSGTGPTLRVECSYDTSYRFSDAVFDGKHFRFTMVNDNGDGDPYTIRYDLVPSADGSQLTGTVDNDHGLTGRQITWTRTDRTYGIGVEGNQG